MPKVKFNRPEDVQENVRLTEIKLPTIGVCGQSDDGLVTIYMSSDRQLRHLGLSPELLATQDRTRIERSISQALSVVLQAVDDVREAEFKGRLQADTPGYPWETIRSLIN